MSISECSGKKRHYTLRKAITSRSLTASGLVAVGVYKVSETAVRQSRPKKAMLQIQRTNSTKLVHFHRKRQVLKPSRQRNRSHNLQIIINYNEGLSSFRESSYTCYTSRRYEISKIVAPMIASYNFETYVA